MLHCIIVLIINLLIVISYEEFNPFTAEGYAEYKVAVNGVLSGLSFKPQIDGWHGLVRDAYFGGFVFLSTEQYIPDGMCFL